MFSGTPLLVGRESECQRLVAAWGQALAGHCQVVSLCGEAGMGKTACLRWLAANCLAETPGTRVEWLSPPPAGETGMAVVSRTLESLLGLRAAPMPEIVGALETLTGIQDPDVLRYEAMLVLYLRGENRPTSQDPSRLQANALALARRLVVKLASLQPAAILLDEAHGLDPLSRNWLANLVDDARAQFCMLLVAGSTVPDRAADLDPFSPRCLAETIPLAPLSERHAREILEFRLAETVAGRDLDDAIQSARGNPACLLAFARALSRGDPLPSSWEAAVRAEIQALSPIERAMADALAVLGAPLEFELLARIAEIPCSPGPTELPALLVNTPAGIWFDQATVAEICLGLLPPADRAVLHRRAGSVIEARSPLEAAHHLERAGDREGLLRVLGAAARAATSRNALEDALALLQRAHDATPADASLPAELTLAQAELEITLGDYDDALALLSRRAGRMSGPDRARAFRLMGRALERKGEYQAARAHHQEGLAVPGNLPARERAGLQAEFATILLRQGHMDEARRAAEQALSILGADEAAPEFALAHSVIGITHYRQGRYPQALEHHRTALALREGAGDLQGTASSLNNLGAVHLDSGNWDEALAAFRRALALAEAAGDVRTHTALLNNIASLQLARGQIAEAEATCREALEAKSRLGEAPGMGISLATLAAILGRRGLVEEALSAADEAISLLEDLGEREILGDVYACRGELLVHRGDGEEALAALNRAKELAEEAGKLAVVARVYRILSELFRQQGSPDDSLAFAQEAVDLNRYLPRKLELARSLLQLERAGGDPDGRAAAEARELFALLGVPPATGAIAS